MTCHKVKIIKAISKNLNNAVAGAWCFTITSCSCANALRVDDSSCLKFLWSGKEFNTAGTRTDA